MIRKRITALVNLPGIFLISWIAIAAILFRFDRLEAWFFRKLKRMTDD